MSKAMRYSDIEDILDTKKKTITLYHVNPTQSTLKKLIKLAKTFNKTVSFQAWKYNVKIDKNTRLKDVFAKCKKIEADRLKPLSPQKMKKAMEALQNSNFDDGPYSGFMSG